MDPDVVRAVYDGLTIGEMSKSRPFISGIVANMMIHEEQRETDIAILLMISRRKRANPITQSSFPPIDSSPSYSPKIMADLLQRRLAQVPINSEEKNGYRVTVASLESALSLAEDTLLVSEYSFYKASQRKDIIGASAPPQPSSSTANLKYPTPKGISSSAQNSLLKSEGPTSIVHGKRKSVPSVEQEWDDDRGQTKKTSPFMSAREKYELEGFKLPPKSTNEKAFVPAKAVSRGSNASAAGKTEDTTGIFDKIEADIIEKGPAVSFEDIAGLSFAKKCVNELICWFHIIKCLSEAVYIRANCLLYGI